MFLAAYVGTDPARLMPEDLHLEEKSTKKLQCFFSAGSLSVLADTFKLSH